MASVYAIGADPAGVTGALESMRVVDGATAPIEVAGKPRAARHRIERSEDRVAEMWIDTDLGIPLRRTGAWGEARLVGLRVEGRGARE